MLPKTTSRRFCISAKGTREAWLFIDSVFPVQIARWDLRHYLGLIREENLLETLHARLGNVTSHKFSVVALEPQRKDGGVFVRFSYSPINPEEDNDKALEQIEAAVMEEADKHSGLPSWLGFTGGRAWVVKGTPWKEDMNRFASPILKIAFEGTDVSEQALYQLCRPYGRIRDLTPAGSVPAGALRFTTITFQRLQSAAIARNVIHGLNYPSGSTSPTRLRVAYQKPIQAHAIRDWMSSHPKIMLPLLVFLFGTLTYTIFDPIRSFMIEGKMLEWFDYRKFKLYRWLQVSTFGRFVGTLDSSTVKETSPAAVWQERKEAETGMKAYLTDTPTTVAFVHGPQGSGKSRMLGTIVEETGRTTLVIDCKDLQSATTDSQLIGALAAQTGYWPVFTFLNSMNNLIDLASIGLIGQKTGLSSSLSDQLKEVLSATETALKGVTSSRRATIQRRIKNDEKREVSRIQAERRRNQIRQGVWHDGRLDCVAGNGIMSELGVGDERFDEADAVSFTAKKHSENEEKTGQYQQHFDTVNALPVVVIRNYTTKIGSDREELLTVLAQWAASLAEKQIAHVIVTSDNRENSKRLAKALPSKPLYTIALSDADASGSLAFLKQKLGYTGIDIAFSAEQTKCVRRLGGRASDLESLIHKMRNGQSVEEAVEEIINQAVSELRKNAFGDDVDDAKSLLWTREQAWKVIRLLSQQPEVPYYDVLVDFPFKGDETALRGMEHAELISISTHEGRPSTICPGKPVFRWVFERLVNDRIFQTTQDIAFNEKMINAAESSIKTYEQELMVLAEVISVEPRHWWGFIFGMKSASRERARYLAEKMLAAGGKLERLERKNVEMKKLLAKA